MSVGQNKSVLLTGLIRWRDRNVLIPLFWDNGSRCTWVHTVHRTALKSWGEGKTRTWKLGAQLWLWENFSIYMVRCSYWEVTGVCSVMMRPVLLWLTSRHEPVSDQGNRESKGVNSSLSPSSDPLEYRLGLEGHPSSQAPSRLPPCWWAAPHAPQGKTCEGEHPLPQSPTSWGTRVAT